MVVAIPVAVLFYFQFRSLNDIETTSAVVLRQLSSDTVDVLAKSIDEAFKRPQIEVILRTPQIRNETLDLPWIEPVFEEGLRESPFIDEFWVWSETSADRPEQMVRVRPGQPQRAGRRRQSPVSRIAGTGRAADAKAAAARARAPCHRGVSRSRSTGAMKYVQVQLRFIGPVARALHQLPGLRRSTWSGSRRSTCQRSSISGWPRCSSPRDSRRCSATLLDDNGKALVGDANLSFVDERTFPVVFFDRELLEYAAPYEQKRETFKLRTSYGPQSIQDIVSAATRPQMALMVVLAW